jgi:hypothetical protein
MYFLLHDFVKRLGIRPLRINEEVSILIDTPQNWAKLYASFSKNQGAHAKKASAPLITATSFFPHHIKELYFTIILLPSCSARTFMISFLTW